MIARKSGKPGRGMQPPPGREIARIGAVEHQDGRRDGRRHQPLGQHTEADGGPGSQHPAARRPSRRRRALRRQECRQRARHVQRQAHVQRQQLPQDHEQQHAREHRRSPESCRRRPRAASRPVRRRASRPRPRARCRARAANSVSPNRAQRQRRCPVLQRRLFDVREAVQMRDNPVAAREHLARNLRIAPLVRIEQRPQRQQSPATARRPTPTGPR